MHLFLAQATIVFGKSMEPNLLERQRLIIDKVSYRLHPPQRNDIVVLNRPDMDEMLVKRIVGLPGETIEIYQGTVYIDDIPMPEPFPHDIGIYSMPPVTLGPLSYFVLGDNRDNSNDSRSFGPVKREHILGRVWLRYWPFQPNDAVLNPQWAPDAGGMSPKSSSSWCWSTIAIGLLVAFRQMISPTIVAFLLAFLLSYPVNWIQRSTGWARGAAILIVYIVLAGLAALVPVLIIPRSAELVGALEESIDLLIVNLQAVTRGPLLALGPLQVSIDQLFDQAGDALSNVFLSPRATRSPSPAASPPAS